MNQDGKNIFLIPPCDDRKEFINGQYGCTNDFVKAKYIPPGVCLNCPVAHLGDKNTVGQCSLPAIPPNINKYNTKFTDRIIYNIETTSNTNAVGPNATQMMLNLLEAIDQFMTDGQHFVTKEDYIGRLTTCQSCPLRNGAKCTEMSCGCDIRNKAMLSTEECPKKYWLRCIY